MAFMAITIGLGLLFYILLGLRFPLTLQVVPGSRQHWAWCAVLADRRNLQIPTGPGISIHSIYVGSGMACL